MRKLFAILLISFMSVQVSFAQNTDALLALGIEIANELNSDADPTNNVAVPTDAAAAQALIASAPAIVVSSSIAAVARANPGMAASVAAAGAGNNRGVSLAQAASAAGVSTASVAQAAARNVTRAVSGTAGTGTGSSSGGGSPGTDDIEDAILANPSLIGDILPGISDADLATIVAVIEGGGTFGDALDTIASGPGSTQ